MTTPWMARPGYAVYSEQPRHLLLQPLIKGLKELYNLLSGKDFHSQLILIISKLEMNSPVKYTTSHKSIITDNFNLNRSQNVSLQIYLIIIMFHEFKLIRKIIFNDTFIVNKEIYVNIFSEES